MKMDRNTPQTKKKRAVSRGMAPSVVSQALRDAHRDRFYLVM